jgi:galactoside O-acetyltransferase
MTSFYTEEELAKLGLKNYGSNILISRKCSIYSPENISLGNNVRIDDFCVLSGKITIGDFVHIAAASLLFGGEQGIIMKDFSGLSSRCVVYAESDDYSGEGMINPTIPNELRKIQGGLSSNWKTCCNRFRNYNFTEC